MSEYQASVIWNRAESEAFTDNPIGIMAKDTEGKLSLTKVTLRPKVVFYNEQQPNFEQLGKMHHQSHQQCFIANSVKTEIVTDITH
jgi:organic hydroperoxide reductase OsmC/OhrA